LVTAESGCFEGREGVYVEETTCSELYQPSCCGSLIQQVDGQHINNVCDLLTFKGPTLNHTNFRQEQHDVSALTNNVNNTYNNNYIQLSQQEHFVHEIKLKMIRKLIEEKHYLNITNMMLMTI
jgi:hypothetical protein